MKKYLSSQPFTKTKAGKNISLDEAFYLLTEKKNDVVSANQLLIINKKGSLPFNNL